MGATRPESKLAYLMKMLRPTRDDIGVAEVLLTLGPDLTSAQWATKLRVEQVRVHLICMLFHASTKDYTPEAACAE